jgi:hypothetical protein
MGHAASKTNGQLDFIDVVHLGNIWLIRVIAPDLFMPGGHSRGQSVGEPSVAVAERCKPLRYRRDADAPPRSWFPAIMIGK